MTKRETMNVLLACVAAAGIAACDVDVEDPGELPTIDVEGGRAPEIDVHGPDIEVGTKEKTITVPDIDVDIPEEHENEPPARVDP